MTLKNIITFIHLATENVSVGYGDGFYRNLNTFFHQNFSKTSSVQWRLFRSGTWSPWWLPPYCSDVTGASWRLKSTATPRLVKQPVKLTTKKIKASHYCHFVLRIHRGFPSQRASNTKTFQWHDIVMYVFKCQSTSASYHDDVIKWKHFPRHCPFVTGEFPAQRPVARSFDVFFDLRLNKRLSKQSWGWWFETLSGPLWRHRNVDQTPNLKWW